MEYDRKTIEERGADFVKQQLRKLNTLDPNIVSNDKGISWDGHILVYQSIPFTKDKLRAKIPTQVKTRTYDKFKKKFNISIADLKNYREEGSILYFWVQIVKDQCKIFYATLFLIDLECIINSNINNKSASIEFFPFPEDIPSIRNFIEEYINTANKQKQVLPNIYDLNAFSKQYPNRPFSFELRLPINPTAKDVVASIINQKPYVYYQYDNGLSVPVGKIEAEQLSLMTEDNIEIRVNDQILYSKVKRESFNDKLRLRIGTTITLDMVGNHLEFNYDIKNANLLETIKTLRFTIALISNVPIYFNNQRMFMGASMKEDIDIKALREQLDWCLDIQILFNKLGIRKDIVLRSLSERELNNLNMLCQSELHNQEVPLGNKDNSFGFVHIGNIHILCYCQQATRQGYYIVKSIFDRDLLSFALTDDDGTSIPVGCYLMLVQEGVDGFRNIDNINYDDLIASLNVDNIPPRVEDAYNTLLLNMLSYYDEIKYPKTLSACLWLSKFLWDRFGKDIYFINFCQVKYRYNTLTDDDKLEIVKMKNTTDKVMVKLACSILLHSFEESQIYYEQLQKADQEVFTQFPINNLWTTSKRH